MGVDSRQAGLNISEIGDLLGFSHTAGLQTMVWKKENIQWVTVLKTKNALLMSEETGEIALNWFEALVTQITTCYN